MYVLHLTTRRCRHLSGLHIVEAGCQLADCVVLDRGRLAVEVETVVVVRPVDGAQQAGHLIQVFVEQNAAKTVDLHAVTSVAVLC